MNLTSFHLYFLSKTSAYLLILISGLILSCEKDAEPITTNSCISGHVYVYDAVYGELPKVKITATGPYGTLSAFSDAEGEFWFENVANGTYNVECSLEGYGSNKAFGIQVFGNDTVFAYLGTICAFPDASLRISTLTEISWESSNRMIVKTNGSNCTDLDTPVRFFMGTESEVSNENYDYTILGYKNYLCEYSVDIYEPRIESGTNVFIVGYICNPWDYGYLDMYRNIVIYPTINVESRSGVLSFMMP